MVSVPPEILMTPGPVPVPPVVLKELSLQIGHHRTPQFQKVLQRVLEMLPPVFETAQRAMVLTSTGTGGMEALVVNTLSPGDEAVCVVAGKFGERWAAMAESYGIIVHRFQVEWGLSVSVSAFESFLRELRKEPQAVLVQACETSTGALQPIRELAATVRKSAPNALLLVDGITALGAYPLPMDQWGIDGLVGGSQKAFMLPTGLSLIALSERAWDKTQSAKCPRFYFDLRKERKANLGGETAYSSNVPLIRSLDAVLSWIEEIGGFRAVHKRIAGLSLATRESARLLGLSPFAATPSPSLTALKLPTEVDGSKLRSHIERTHSVVTMGGQDQLKGRVLRIGHMGYISDEDLIQTIRAIGESLRTLNPESSLSPEQVHTAVLHCQSVLNRYPAPWKQPL